MALIWRPLVAESLDPGFLRSVSVAGRWAHIVFLVLVHAHNPHLFDFFVTIPT